MSPGGSGYFTCIQNTKLVTTEFKSGGLHEKHVVATWNLGNHLLVVTMITNYCYNAQCKLNEPVVSADHKIFTRSLTCHELKCKSLAAVAHWSSCETIIAPDVLRVPACACRTLDGRPLCSCMLCCTVLLSRRVAFIKPEICQNDTIVTDFTSQNTRLPIDKVHSVNNVQANYRCLT